MYLKVILPLYRYETFIKEIISNMNRLQISNFGLVFRRTLCSVLQRSVWDDRIKFTGDKKWKII